MARVVVMPGSQSALAKINVLEYEMPVEEWTQRLRALPGLHATTNIRDPIWKMRDTRCTRTINWNVLAPLNRSTVFDLPDTSDDLILFAKKLWISLAEEISTNIHHSTEKVGSAHLILFEAILLTLSFCERQRTNTIRDEHIAEFVSFFVMNGVSVNGTDGPISKRRSPLSYYTVRGRIIDTRWCRVIDPARGWPQIGFVSSLALNAVINAHRKLIDDFYSEDLTWGDYKKGGTLDRLGLDSGQYYVAHCMHLVERYGPVALAFADLYSRLPEFSTELNITEKTLDLNLSAILSGDTVRKNGLAEPKHSFLVNVVQETFLSSEIGHFSANENTAMFYSELELRNPHRPSLPQQTMALIIGAATVCFVALSGWRASEYRFSMSDIKTSRNKDPLTQKATPQRRFVRWVVPKSTDDILHDREITEGQYEYLVLLAKLNGAHAEEPCLVNRSISRMSNKTVSYLAIPWEDFVVNGEMPEELKRRLMKELPHWKLRNRFSSIQTAVRQGAYSRRPASERAVLENLVDEKTRELLKSNDPCAASGLYAKVGEVIAKLGLLRPTSHSFRHMWAEAVLRRFDGDVGWMIRSQFKHFGERFWRAYISGKSNRAVAYFAQGQVVSDLLYKVLRRKGPEYAGPTIKVIHRLFSGTKLLNPAAQSSIEKFVDERVDHFKATPWGYCILRNSSSRRSKCAEDGHPQPQNASEKVCLNCTNFLTSKHHSNEMLFIAQTHSEIVVNEALPGGFRIESANVLRAAAGYLRQWDINLPKNVANALDKIRSK